MKKTSPPSLPPTPDTTERIVAAIDSAIDRAAGLVSTVGEATVRIGVTGLARSGKTVFTTSLVNNLLHPSRLEMVSAVAEARLDGAVLRPQPDHATPRFPYETHLQNLQKQPPDWPQPTQTVSQLRLSVRYRPGSFLKRQLGDQRTLNIDIIDYPGEWLVDLSLLRRTYRDWSVEALAALEGADHEAATAYLGHLDAIDPKATEDDVIAQDLSDRFRAALSVAGPTAWAIQRIAPGRFRHPGDLTGTPLTTFAPLPPWPADLTGRGSIWSMMEQRYDSYRRHVSQAFFERHVAKLDRQIVLVDPFSLVEGAAGELDAFRHLLQDILACFRYGQAVWPRFLFGSKIEKVVFAATKSDLVPTDQHERIEGFVNALLSEAQNRARFSRSAVTTMAISALRTTTDDHRRVEGSVLPCVRGVPTDGTAPICYYPGRFPAHPGEIRSDNSDGFRSRFFQPPPSVGMDARGVPHLRLDKIIEHLIGDALT